MPEFLRNNKTIPSSRENHGVVNNSPDVELQERGWNCLKIELPKNGHVILAPNSFRIREGAIGKKKIPGMILTPITIVPLTGVYHTSRGGHRVGGGGTSVEALRRAKRKAKQRAR